MLRVSAQTTGNDIEIDAVNGNAESAGSGVPHGAELIRFAEALARRDAGALSEARAALLAAAGPAVLVDAAGVAANFQRMVRIADPIGIPVDSIDSDLSREIRRDLSLDRFVTARNTPGATAEPATEGTARERTG